MRMVSVVVWIWVPFCDLQAKFTALHATIDLFIWPKRRGNKRPQLVVLTKCLFIDIGFTFFPERMQGKYYSNANGYEYHFWHVSIFCLVCTISNNNEHMWRYGLTNQRNRSKQMNANYLCSATISWGDLTTACLVTNKMTGGDVPPNHTLNHQKSNLQGQNYFYDNVCSVPTVQLSYNWIPFQSHSKNGILHLLSYWWW